MVKPILYAAEASPAVRSVFLIARAINLELEIKTVNLAAGDHLKPEYIKINPQHTVPTLDDNGQYLWESHAICTYLIDKYATDDSLYPKDLYTRAKIHQRLHFNSSILFDKIRACSIAVFFRGATEFPADAITGFQSVYDFLEVFLANDKYLVGNSVTVADYCIVANVSNAQVLLPLDPVKYPNISDWFQRMKKIPFYDEANGKGSEIYKQMVEAKLKANKSAAAK